MVSRYASAEATCNMLSLMRNFMGNRQLRYSLVEDRIPMWETSWLLCKAYGCLIYNWNVLFILYVLYPPRLAWNYHYSNQFSCRSTSRKCWSPLKFFHNLGSPIVIMIDKASTRPAQLIFFQSSGAACSYADASRLTGSYDFIFKKKFACTGG